MSDIKNIDPKQGLCFRCESRARFWETGSGPRCECQDYETAVYGCYMYTPVLPVVLKKNEGDTRPQFAGAMLSARSHFVRVAEDAEMSVKKDNDGLVLYWVPKDMIKKPVNKIKHARKSVRKEK
jgi:hypothetical protein